MWKRGGGKALVKTWKKKLDFLVGVLVLEADQVSKSYSVL